MECQTEYFRGENANLNLTAYLSLILCANFTIYHLIQSNTTPDYEVYMFICLFIVNIGHDIK